MMTDVEEPRFYYLKNPRLGESGVETDCLDADPVNRGEAPRCPLCGHFVGMLPWLPPHRAELDVWGSAFGDVVHSVGSSLLITDRFATAFRQEGLTGIEGFDPVEVVKVRRRSKAAPKTKPPRYYHVDVLRSRTIIDQAASMFEWEEPPTCSECRIGSIIKRWKHIFFEPGTWQGEDIFLARGMSGAYFTSERFKDFCDRHTMANAVLIPAEDYSHDFYPGEK